MFSTKSKYVIRDGRILSSFTHSLTAGTINSFLEKPLSFPIIDPTEKLEGFHEREVVARDPSHLDCQIIAILCQLFVDRVASERNTAAINYSRECEAQAQVTFTERWHNIVMSLGGEDQLT